MLGYSYCIFISSYGSIINELKMNRYLYKFIFTMVNYIITFIVKTYISLYKYSYARRSCGSEWHIILIIKNVCKTLLCIII